MNRLAPARGFAVLVVGALLLAACAPFRIARHPPPEETRPLPPSPPPRVVRPTPPPKIPPEPDRRVLATHPEFFVVRASPTDTFETLAGEFLGSPDLAWTIADFNEDNRVRPGREVVIPRASLNPVGVYPEGVQTVPILCYHRFGDKKAKMVVSPQAFAKQMAYLAENGYRVVPLSALPGYLRGTQPLPKRAVIITMDDGYKSVHRWAFPVLKRHGFPATVFLYTDFLGAGSALSTDEIRELLGSGLVEIQPHSKAHSNLGLPNVDESPSEYLKRVEDEITLSTAVIRKRFDLTPYAFAYPYGDASESTVQHLKDHDFQLGLTVQSGGNPSFGAPYLVRRTMVYGGESLESFQKKLAVFRSVQLR